MKKLNYKEVAKALGMDLNKSFDPNDVDYSEDVDINNNIVTFVYEECMVKVDDTGNIITDILPYTVADTIDVKNNLRLIVDEDYEDGYDGYLAGKGRAGVINGQNKIIIPVLYNHIELVNENLIIVERNEKYGLYSTDGEVILPTMFGAITILPLNNILVSTKSIDTQAINYSCHMDKNEKINFGTIYYCTENGKCGVFNPLKGWILPLECEAIDASNSYFFKVKKNNKCGIVDINGNILVPLEFDGLSNSSNDNLIKVYNFNNKEDLKSSRYIHCLNLNFSNENDYYIHNKKIGLFNSDFEQVCQCIYDNIYDVRYDVFKVKQGGKVGVFNYKTRENIIPVEYNYISSFFDDSANAKQKPFAKVEKNGLWGTIDTNGEIIVSLKYDNLKLLGQGSNHGKLAILKVEKNGHCGLIDSNGKIIVPIIYDDVYSINDNLFEGEKFIGGLFRLRLQNTIYYLNEKGDVLKKIKYLMIPRFDLGYEDAETFKKDKAHENLSFYHNYEIDIPVPSNQEIL